MNTPEEWAADIKSLYDPPHNSAVDNMVRKAMQSVYEDILDLIEEDYMDDEGIARGIRDRMIEVFGEEEDDDYYY